MSMFNLHKFLEKLKTVTSHTSDKSDEARAIKARTQSLQRYLEQDLAELAGTTTSSNLQSSAVALARLRALAETPWQQDQSLKAIWNDQVKSRRVVDQLLKQIADQASKPSAKHHLRAAHLLEFLRQNRLYEEHTPQPP